MTHVSVTVNGRSYRMACDPGQEEHLKSLGYRLDEQVAELKGTFGEVGDQRLTVMAAILLTDRLVEAEARLAALGEEVARLSAEKNDAVDRVDGLEGRLLAEVERAAERAEALERRLDRALAGQTSPLDPATGADG